MTPEIRAAVKTLAAAFQAILEALAREETPPARPSPPAQAPADHEAHFVVNRLDGGSDFCCDQHLREYEANVARYGSAPQAIDALAGPQRRYISERLGLGPRR
jgi:hypothetical protein